MGIIGGYKQEQLARAEQWLPSVIARVPEITSADKAYQWMRQNELYVPRSYVREMWRTIIRGQETITIDNRLDDSDLIPRNWMQDTTFQYGQKYNYIMRIDGHDISSGIARTEYITVVSGENLTVGEIRGVAYNAAQKYGFALADTELGVSFDVIKWKGT